MMARWYFVKSNMMESTPLRQQVAQLFMMGFEGSEMHPGLLHWIAKEQVGGLLFFDKDMRRNHGPKNIMNARQVAEFIGNMQTLTAEAGAPPLFMAVDFEGGAVNRLRDLEGSPVNISPRAFSGLSDAEQNDITHAMASYLKRLGFNLNFTPLLDLDIAKQGIIGGMDRTLGRCPKEVTRLARNLVALYNQQGIICCYKHFPGHGSAVEDSHLGFVDVSECYHPDELEPYRALLETNEPDGVMVMTAHVINRKLDSSGLPATLSRAILTGLLRQEMHFDGVVISDDLHMKAISDNYGLQDAIAQTLNAGADMIIIANQLDYTDASQAIDMTMALVAEGKLSAARITESFKRVQKLKARYLA